jgi:exodeoxyribonuclease VII large subunit
MDGVFTVGEVVRYVQDILTDDLVLSGLWVQGEVSNLTVSSAGHTYFTLKDAVGQLRCVFFHTGGARGARAARSRPATLKQGDEVLAHGRVGMYEVQGSLQLYVDIVQQAGIGPLHLQFEQLCARLLDEGLFAEERKRELPVIPRRIGVVTSPQAAAFQDICRVLASRFPAVDVVLSPSLVQGIEAPRRLVAALDRLIGVSGIDVIILARGGGSLEDLWAFNDEELARAIVASPIPIVTGIGHETDTTIADFAADLRAPTPSAAAAAVVPDRRELMARIADVARQMREEMDAYLSEHRAHLARSVNDLGAWSPLRTIQQRRQRIDDLVQVGRDYVVHQLRIRSERLHGEERGLHLLSPMLTLDRGFALVLRDGGRIVRDAEDLGQHEPLRIRFRDGEVGVVVTHIMRSTQ